MPEPPEKYWPLQERPMLTKISEALNEDPTKDNILACFKHYARPQSTPHTYGEWCSEINKFLDLPQPESKAAKSDQTSTAEPSMSAAVEAEAPTESQDASMTVVEAKVSPEGQDAEMPAVEAAASAVDPEKGSGEQAPPQSKKVTINVPEVRKHKPSVKKAEPRFLFWNRMDIDMPDLSTSEARKEHDHSLLPFYPSGEPAARDLKIWDLVENKQVYDPRPHIPQFQEGDFPAIIKNRKEDLPKPDYQIPAGGESLEEQRIRLKLQDCFEQQHPSLQCFFHCWVDVV